MSQTRSIASKSPRALLQWALFATVLALTTGFALSSWAGVGHGGGMMGGPMFEGRHVDRMLDGLNATDAQRTQIKQIVQAAATDLQAQRETGRTLREQGLKLLTAPTIDASAAEALRQQMLAQHDLTSRRMLQAMIDIGNVITPEQRAKLGQRLQQRGEAMHERMDRMQRGGDKAPS